MLVVQTVNYYPQRNATQASTVLYGEQVLLPFTGAVGTAAPQDYTFWEWFQNLTGKPTVWNQMRAIPMETLDQYIMRWPKLPLFSIAQGTMTLLAAGNDPLKGYWLQFAGQIPIFNQPNWWEETEDELYSYDPEC